VEGPCTVRVVGVDPNRAATPGRAAPVDAGGVLSAAVTSTGRITAHRVLVEVAGFRFAVTEGSDDASQWQGGADLGSYSRIGVGLFRVVVESDGPGGCTASAFVRITGRNPLATAAGAGAALSTLLGLVWLWLAIRAARGGREPPPEERPGVPEPAPGERTDRSMWVFGALAGLVLGIGPLLLLQQFALVYPTRILAVVALLAGLDTGLVLPAVLRSMARRRAAPHA
jgi:hypothetical protein